VTRQEGRRQTRRPSASGLTRAPDGRPGRTAGRVAVRQSTAHTDFQRALAIFQARLGPDHLDVAQARTSLQIVLGELSEVPASRTPL
jgi:hypothetical protein